MATFAEIKETIGAMALLETSHGLTFEVTVTDYKESYGTPRYRVVPVSGTGESWVNTTSLIWPTDRRK